MLAPLIRRPRRGADSRSGERGVTLALVAIAMFSIIAMAGLSIDVGTLYEANAEAQRSADAAALAAARVLSLTGITGDPTNSTGLWSTACAAATTVAQAVANQDTIGGAVPSAVTVTYLSTDGTNCGSASGGAFGVNPMVKVQVQQASLRTYFARIWGRTANSVSATATAEAFNPSQTDSLYGTTTPVQPRCVKPWIVPNKDPGSTANQFVSTTATTQGAIQRGKISVSNNGAGVIGEQFTLSADCNPGGRCGTGTSYTAPIVTGGATQFMPALVSGTPMAVPSCSGGTAFEQAVTGCDQTTAYQCGVLSAVASNPNEADLNERNVPSNTYSDVQCLTIGAGGGGTPDSINTGTYPYQITAGSSNPLGVSGTPITSSNSIVSIPIYDGATLSGSNTPPVTIVGFLQLFIQSVTPAGQMTVTVLNVAGCGNAVPNGTQPIYGSSPVPIRLITPQ